MTSAEITAASQPYYSSQSIYPTRCYQRAAINRTVDTIARDQQRLLLVMATGPGKTHTVFQVVHRLLKSGLKHKVLYLVGRIILIDRSIGQDFSPLEKQFTRSTLQKTIRSRLPLTRYSSPCYQQLTGDNSSDDEEAAENDAVSRLAALFRKDFFGLVIVGECRRGPAKRTAAGAKSWIIFPPPRGLA